MFAPCHPRFQAAISLLLSLSLLPLSSCINVSIPRSTFWTRKHVSVITGSQASFVLFANNGAYCATKHALLALAESLAQELAATPVGVSLLAPGAVATAIHGEATSPNAAAAMPAEAAAGIAFAGARRGDFLISTHADLAPRLAARQAAQQAMLAR